MLRLQFLIRTRWYHSSIRLFSTTPAARKKHCCKLLVVGGGSAGIATAIRFSKTLHKHEVIVVEPKEIHYYRPYFTLIGCGEKELADTVKATIHIQPDNVTWINDLVVNFCPLTNTVVLGSGNVVEYDIMVIAVGLKMDFDQIRGLKEALENYRSVCSIYSAKYVRDVFKTVKEFVSGCAIFTAPKTPTKCLSASFEICFLAEDYFRRNDRLAEADVTYTTAQPSFMPIKVYDEFIWKLAKRRRIDVHVKTNLVEVVPERREAIFECLNKPGNKITLEYSMLHVTPPMRLPDEVANCKDLIDTNKFVNVDFNTMQHKKFPNVFALGDCTPAAGDKTASALGSQSFVVFQNISSILRGKTPEAKYDGYTACPVLTGRGRCMLAEFDYTLKPKETMPFRQDYESKAAYYFVKYIMVHVYWSLLLKGLWNGMDRIRRALHLQFFKRRRKKR